MLLHGKGSQVLPGAGSQDATLKVIYTYIHTLTSGMADTLNAMIEHFTPADEEATDNDYHKAIRQ
jgi:hypothetical protein